MVIPSPKLPFSLFVRYLIGMKWAMNIPLEFAFDEVA
jgi:hypothetical protein